MVGVHVKAIVSEGYGGGIGESHVLVLARGDMIWPAQTGMLEMALSCLNTFCK